MTSGRSAKRSLRSLGATVLVTFGVFGSVVRGDADAASDVDFLVELEPGRSLFDLGGLLMDLQEHLHCKVDVTTPAMLKSRVRERVPREACRFEERIMRSRARLDDSTSAAPQRPLYDEDIALWVEGQGAALRAGDVAALDLPNLIEELEGLTKRDERALGSQLKRIMAHLLKQRSQPERASRSRVGSIENGREEIADILEQSPSLRDTCRA
jgi:predicted nucleotidyltransferase